MSIETDLEKTALQEEQLRFPAFSAAEAWRVGTALKTAAETRGAALAIEITLAGQPLFFYLMPGATPNNADWIRRKHNVVNRFHRSSYAMGLTMQKRGTSLQAAYGLALQDHADHGGGFPLIVEGIGCIGSIVVSGLPQREDHNLIVETLAALLGRDPAVLRLPD